MFENIKSLSILVNPVLQQKNSQTNLQNLQDYKIQILILNIKKIIFEKFNLNQKLYIFFFLPIVIINNSKLKYEKRYIAQKQVIVKTQIITVSFSGIKKLLLQLDELQELYLAIMEQSQKQLQNINYYSDCKFNITQIYSSNRPLELLEVLQNYLIEIKNEQNPKYRKLNKKSKQLIISLNKAKSVQQQINQYLEILSNLVKKLNYKKECQILITSISLILKKRQKFQLKLLQNNNQLSENLNSLSEVLNQENTKGNMKQYLEIKTLQNILDQKVSEKIQNKKQETEVLSQTVKIKEEYQHPDFYQDNQINQYSQLNQTFLSYLVSQNNSQEKTLQKINNKKANQLQLYQSQQQQMYYTNFIYQMYQSYSYFNQLKQTECNILNSQLIYNQHPFIYHYYPQFQQKSQY